MNAPAPGWIVASEHGARALAVPVVHCEPCGEQLPADHHYLIKKAVPAGPETARTTERKFS